MKRIFVLAALAVRLDGAQGNPAAEDQTPAAKVLQLKRAGRLTEAKALAQRILAEAPTGETSAAYRASAMYSIGSLENELGQFTVAEPLLQSGLELVENKVSAVPHVVVALLTSLAEARMNQYRTEEAEADLRRALRIAGQYLPPEHIRLAPVWDGFGLIYYVRGQYTKAEKAFRRSMAILEKNLGATHPEFHAQAMNLGTMLVIVGREKEALRLLVPAVRSLEDRLGAAHPDTIRGHCGLGTALVRTDAAKGEQILRQAIANWRKISLPEANPTILRCFGGLTATLIQQKQMEEAVSISERSVELMREMLGPNHPQTVVQMLDHAGVLQAAKRKKESEALRVEVERIRVATGYADSKRHTVDVIELRGKR